MNRALSKQFDGLVQVYSDHLPLIDVFHNQLLDALTASKKLGELVHSIRSRLKDPDHLKDKLYRKWKKKREAGEQFAINKENLLVSVNDLVGIRILHLYTRQIKDIDVVMREILDENQYKLVGRPFARTWDDESRAFFDKCKIKTEKSPTLYTSVHYVVASASRTKLTAEIQVRTLMEEVWGEVDHKLNYPHETNSRACREQLKVLARVTSSATRLVDSIFSTQADDDVRVLPETRVRTSVKRDLRAR